MSSRESLLDVFLGTATDRLVAMGEVVSTLTEASGPELFRKLARDLHTLKGESRMLGLDAIERLAHAAEDVLFSHERAGCFGAETQEPLYEAVDTIFECVQAAKAGMDPPAQEVAAVIGSLKRTAGQPEQPDGVEVAPCSESTPANRDPVAGPAVDPTPLEKPSIDVGPADELGVRVRVATLDRIGELVAALSGSLVRSREYLAELGCLHDDAVKRLQLADGLSEDASASMKSVHRAQAEVLRRFDEDLSSTGLVDAELSEAVRTSRLRPLSYVFSTYPALVRRIAAEQNKKIRFEMHGLDATVEQRVADEIAEPCLHLLRNAIAHGIEPPQNRRVAGKPEAGSIRLTATQEGGLIRIDFVDDGRGMDPDRLAHRALALGLTTSTALAAMSETEIVELAFHPGLSTASSVSKIAGRGVGLDVVRDVLERLGGSVKLHSCVGTGCRFTLLVPVSVSIVRVLLVEAALQVFAIPSTAVVETYWLPLEDIRADGSHESTFYRGQLLPLARLRELLQMRGLRDQFANRVTVLVVRAGDELAGVIVDRCLGEREVVARPFGGFLGRPETTAGITVLEDGSLLVILHSGDLVRTVRKTQARTLNRSVSTAEGGVVHRVLYAEDSLITREYAARVLRARGFDVVEVTDGMEALETLKTQSFDMVLTDLQMPRMDGFKLTATIRRDPKYKTLPIVVLSSVDEPETKQMALHVGADAYVVKSQFGVDSLVSTLRQVLG